MVDFHLLYTNLKSVIMKKLMLLIIGAFIGPAIIAQEVISSGGETQTASGYEICWTLGESVIETFSSGSNILTQGFHQSKLTATPISEVLYSGIELKVFPNPSRDFIIIQLTDLVENLHYSLYDGSGKLLEKMRITSTRTQLDLKNYANGQYILQLTAKSGELLQSFKILKE